MAVKWYNGGSYDNEHEVGQALQQLYAEGVVTRADMFIQAKLWNSNHRPEHVEEDLDATLKDLQTDYVDSFVIHWPIIRCHRIYYFGKI